jgi:hypothetical protein
MFQTFRAGSFSDAGPFLAVGSGIAVAVEDSCSISCVPFPSRRTSESPSAKDHLLSKAASRENVRSDRGEAPMAASNSSEAGMARTNGILIRAAIVVVVGAIVLVPLIR